MNEASFFFLSFYKYFGLEKIPKQTYEKLEKVFLNENILFFKILVSSIQELKVLK